MLIYFLPAIIIIGLITCFEDLKYHKIRNIYTLTGIIYAIFIYSIIFIQNQYFKGILNTITNLSFAIIISFLIWNLGFWSAGDAKLFIAFAFLIPLDFYKYNTFHWIESSTLLFNIAFISLIYLLTIIITKTKKKELLNIFKNSLKTTLNPKTLLTSISRLIILITAINFLPINKILKLLLVITIYIELELKIKKDYYISPVIAIVLITIVPNMNFLQITRIFITWKLLQNIFNNGIFNKAKDIFSPDIKTIKLKTGMILNSKYEIKTNLTKKQIQKIKQNKNINLYAKNQNGILEYQRQIKKPIRLSKEQIKIIQNLPLKEIQIQKTVSFAPIIFISTLITVLTNHNLFIIIQRLLF